MAEKKADKTDRKPETKPEAKQEKQTSETVHLSADELRKISGGGTVVDNPGPKR